MISTTLKLSVTGSSHTEIVAKTELALSKFFDIETIQKINYEIFVEKSVDEDKSSDYTAQITAKVRNEYNRKLF